MEVMADLRKESITDRLTGLFNYSYFIDELQREQSRAERTNSHFSLVIFDLDLFKQVNDTYGHEKGNLLLQEVAAILKANARKMDTVARYGGEEFVILMPESNGAEMEVAERIRRKIEEVEFIGIAEQPIRITISGGVCTYPRDARSVNELLDKADKGLLCCEDVRQEQDELLRTGGVLGGRGRAGWAVPACGERSGLERRALKQASPCRLRVLTCSCDVQATAY